MFGTTPPLVYRVPKRGCFFGNGSSPAFKNLDLDFKWETVVGFLPPPRKFQDGTNKKSPHLWRKNHLNRIQTSMDFGVQHVNFRGVTLIIKVSLHFLGGTSREKFNGWERSEGPIRPINSKMLAKPIPFSIPVWKKTTRWRWTYPKYVGGFLWSKVERQSWFQLGFQWSRSSSLFSTSNPWLNQATFCCCGWHVESSF